MKHKISQWVMKLKRRILVMTALLCQNTETLENSMDNCYGPRSNQYNLRQRRKPMYLNLRLNIFHMN